MTDNIIQSRSTYNFITMVLEVCIHKYFESRIVIINSLNFVKIEKKKEIERKIQYAGTLKIEKK